MLTTFLTLALFVLSTNAHAAQVANVDYQGAGFRVRAELHYDRSSKRPDLWMVFEEHNAHGTLSRFTATTMAPRFPEAEWRLTAAPVSRVDDETVFIYYGFDLKTGVYDGNHSVALIFHMPAAQLPEPILEQFIKHFPRSIGRDSAGKPLYVKAVLCRITENQVYPVAAFDAERSLPWMTPAP